MVGFIVFGALALIVAVLLIFAVVIQNSKGGGLSSTFGGASSATQLLGTRRSNEFIERVTWYLAIGLAVIAFMSNIIGTGPTQDTSLRMQKTLDGQVNTAPLQAPVFQDDAPVDGGAPAVDPGTGDQ